MICLNFVIKLDFQNFQAVCFGWIEITVILITLVTSNENRSLKGHVLTGNECYTINIV